MQRIRSCCSYIGILLEGREGNPAHDDGEAHVLGEALSLAVDEEADHGGHDGLACLDDLAEQGVAAQREHGGGVGGGGAEADGDGLDQVTRRNAGHLLGAGQLEAEDADGVDANDPEQQRISCAHAELHGGDRHGVARVLAAHSHQSAAVVLE